MPSVRELTITVSHYVVLLFMFNVNQMVVHSAQHIMQAFNGHVGGGNYSYYKLTLDGEFILVLNSLKGDADLYVSENNPYPTFDLENHVQQSTTCGQEKVLIAKNLVRPVGIGVYGHPSHEASSYELLVLLDDEMHDKYVYYVDGEASIDYNKIESQQWSTVGPSVGKDEEESILWTILVGILKVLLEILAS